MTNSRVSIIVPFYNTEKYIAICLKSLSEQIYQDIEIICINDGSTDSSRLIAENFRKEDKRIYLIDQENAGCCAARNAGLEIASGKYIMFCDSDDYYEPEMVSTMVEYMEADAEIDLATCGSFTHYISGKKRNLEKYLYQDKNGLFNLTQSMKNEENILLWNKIFRKELWDKYNITLCKGRRGDDENRVFKYLSVSKNIFYINKKLYHHIIRESSLIGLLDGEPFIFQFLAHLDDIANFLDTHNLWTVNADFYAKRLLYFLNQFSSKNFDNKNNSNLYREILRVSHKVKKHNIIDYQTRNAISSLQCGYISDCQFFPNPDIKKMNKSVPIVFSCDNNYIKYLPVTLQSLIENSSQDNIYHIIIIDCGINYEFIDIIQEQINNFKNFTLSVVSAKNFLEKHKSSFREKDRFTTAVYGRLLIPEICGNFDKVIYAEADMIFNRDIAELMTVDLEDNYIAAVIDISMEAFFASRKKYSYVRNELEKDVKSYYILSGFMLFNVRKWKDNFLTEKCINLLKNKLGKSLWADQDSINLACKNKIYYLDQSWNCCPFIEERFKDPDFIEVIKKNSFIEKLCSQYVMALTGPDTVFHYATEKKPWNSFAGKTDRHWWSYCRKTKIYEKILFEFNENTSILKEITKRYTNIFFRIKTTDKKRKYYLFGLRVAKTVEYMHKKIYYILELPVLKIRIRKK